MRNTSFRLDEYKIIQNECGDLWWESHTGFCSFQSGKCCLRENILFLEPPTGLESGFLKREFGEQLEPLPVWNKSRYYCKSHIIRDCKSGKKQLWNQMIADRIFPDSVPVKRNRQSSDTSYKLGRYIIREYDNGHLQWESYGVSSISSGTCFMEGDILFMEPGKTGESDFRKKEFQKQREQLPEWEKTRYYCAEYALHSCGTGNMPYPSEIKDRPDEPVRSRKSAIPVKNEISGDLKIQDSGLLREEAQTEKRNFFSVIRNISEKKSGQSFAPQTDREIRGGDSSTSFFRKQTFRIPVKKAEDMIASLAHVKENITGTWKLCKDWVSTEVLNKHKP